MAVCLGWGLRLANGLFSFEGRTSRKRPWRVALALAASNLATSAFFLLATTPSASAQDEQDNVKGTVCEAPTDEDTRSACFVVMLQCSFATVYGRTEDEQNQLYKGCIRKLVARYKRGMDATGDAVRQEFAGSPADRAAAKKAARQKAQEQAAAAAAQAKQQQEWQQAAQQRVDTVKQACTTGQGTLDVVGVTHVDGVRIGVMDVWAYRGQVVQPVADPDAVAIGKCSVEFTQGNYDVTGRIAMGSLEPNGIPSATSGGN